MRPDHRNLSVDANAVLQAFASGDYPSAAQILSDFADDVDRLSPEEARSAWMAFAGRLALNAVLASDGLDNMQRRLNTIGNVVM